MHKKLFTGKLKSSGIITLATWNQENALSQTRSSCGLRMRRQNGLVFFAPVCFPIFDEKQNLKVSQDVS